MQDILGLMRKAITTYDMIKPNDHIAVGVSGGKDSMVLLIGLARLKSFIGIPFELTAISLDPVFGGVKTDYSPIAKICEQHGVRFVERETDIGEVVFTIRQEKNPCSLCARMRRGILHDLCNELGCNKLALGHHYDDALETFVMNLFHEGRLGSFSPVTYLSRKDITMIRPLCLTPEAEIRRVVARESIPIVKSKCPIDGTTTRQEIKEWLLSMEQTHPGIKKRMFGALRRAGLSGWAG